MGVCLCCFSVVLLLLLLLSGLSFEVLSLERQVQGSNLPLPKTLIKSLLNVVMPSVSVLWCACGCNNFLKQL
jgi:hypothetical protein